jgi:hypothetical protein
VKFSSRPVPVDSQTKGAAEEIIGKASSAIIGHDVDTELAAQSQGAQIENAADVAKVPSGRRACGTRRIVEMPFAVAPACSAEMSSVHPASIFQGTVLEPKRNCLGRSSWQGSVNGPQNEKLSLPGNYFVQRFHIEENNSG